MDIRKALKSQYHAALAMLRQTIDRCPDDLWTAGEVHRPFWRIAYHALFYTHFYLQPNKDVFQPWEKSRTDCQCLQWGPDEEPIIYAPYTKLELLEYWSLCEGMIDAGIDRLDLDSPVSGFPWYAMSKLEHQIVNIRHTQQHTGQLSEILNLAAVDTDWIGKRH